MNIQYKRWGFETDMISEIDEPSHEKTDHSSIGSDQPDIPSPDSTTAIVGHGLIVSSTCEKCGSGKPMTARKD